jgi:hypothetical protein
VVEHLARSGDALSFWPHSSSAAVTHALHALHALHAPHALHTQHTRSRHARLHPGTPNSPTGRHLSTLPRSPPHPLCLFRARRCPFASLGPSSVSVLGRAEPVHHSVSQLREARPSLSPRASGVLPSSSSSSSPPPPPHHRRAIAPHPQPAWVDPSASRPSHPFQSNSGCLHYRNCTGPVRPHTPVPCLPPAAFIAPTSCICRPSRLHHPSRVSLHPQVLRPASSRVHHHLPSLRLQACVPIRLLLVLSCSRR